MLSRHEGSVDFKSYVWEGATMQRSDNFKADEKNLFDLLNIISKDGFKIAMPLFLEYPLLVKILSWYSNFNKQMKIYGKRRTLPYYIVTHACTPLLNYLFRIINRYGFEKVSLAQRKACNQDAEIELHDYFIIYCIAHNHLYRSDGFAGINDEIAKDCEIGLSDIPCYDGPLAQTYEYPEMHSYFANSQLDRIRKNRIKKQNLKK